MAASGTLYAQKRLAPLDGLRGIAVLLVLWYHVWEISWLPAPARWLQFVPETGFVGVHLFFFLSGFVISYPFVQALVRGERRPSWEHFAWRRFLKIVPSYVLSIAVAYAIGYAPTQSTAPTIEAILSHLLFIHTWFLPTYGSINGVLWTLAVEVEFYLIFPLIWWSFSRAPWLTGGTMIAVAIAWRYALGACCYYTLFPSYSENLPGYLDIFACGMLCALVYCKYGEQVRERLSRFAPLLLIAGVAATIALLEGLYSFRMHDQWQAVWQMGRRQWFGLAFAAVALGALWSPRVVQALFGNPLLVFLGTVSYNLYLYHQMIARELLWNRVPYYAGDPHGDPHWQMLYTVVAIAACVVEAALVTYLIERPLLRLPDPPKFRALLQTWSNAVRR